MVPSCGIVFRLGLQPRYLSRSVSFANLPVAVQFGPAAFYTFFYLCAGTMTWGFYVLFLPVSRKLDQVDRRAHRTRIYPFRSVGICGPVLSNGRGIIGQHVVLVCGEIELSRKPTRGWWALLERDCRYTVVCLVRGCWKRVPRSCLFFPAVSLDMQKTSNRLCVPGGLRSRTGV
jgi:hypothetical protein